MATSCSAVKSFFAVMMLFPRLFLHIALLTLLLCCLREVRGFSLLTPPLLLSTTMRTPPFYSHHRRQFPLFATTNTPKEHLVPRITTIENLSEYLEFLSTDDRLCVVKFYSHVCKTCQKFGVLFRRWGGDSGVADARVPGRDEYVHCGPVRLAEIDTGLNRKICKAFRIQKYPLIHIYKEPYGLICAFPCDPNHFEETLERTVERLLQMSNEEILQEKVSQDDWEAHDAILQRLREDL